MPNLSNAAKHLRKNMTKSERTVWLRLKRIANGAPHFRRQCPFGAYIPDFISHRYKIIVEVDGEHHTHDAQIHKDAMKDAYFQQEGYSVFRITTHQLHTNIDYVADVIEGVCREKLESSHPLPTPAARTSPLKGEE